MRWMKVLKRSKSIAFEKKQQEDSKGIPKRERKRALSEGNHRKVEEDYSEVAEQDREEKEEYLKRKRMTMQRRRKTLLKK